MTYIPVHISISYNRNKKYGKISSSQVVFLFNRSASKLCIKPYSFIVFFLLRLYQFFRVNISFCSPLVTILILKLSLSFCWQGYGDNWFHHINVNNHSVILPVTCFYPSWYISISLVDYSHRLAWCVTTEHDTLSLFDTTAFVYTQLNIVWR